MADGTTLSIAPTGFGQLNQIDPWNPNKRPIKPTSQFGDPASFTAAADTQAKDYDSIMKQYADLAKSYQANPLTATPVSFSPIAPQTTQYTQSGDVTKSLSDLSNLADTGGYSAADIANIRERDISPIRSIYANDRRELERNRTLSGGYSPNFAAVSAQMARDEANKIGDITTKANAGIAEDVASKKLAASGSYAGASASANAAKTAVDQHNTDIVNQINEANAARKAATDQFNTNTSLAAQEANRGAITDTVRGQASLYGTTPALTQTFGNQVVQAKQLGMGQQDLNNRRLSTLAAWR